MRKEVNTQNNKLEDHYLTVPQLSSFLGIAIQTIYNKVNLGELVPRKMFGRLYFSKTEILDEIEKAIPDEN